MPFFKFNCAENFHFQAILCFFLSLFFIVKHCVILSNHRIPLPHHNSQVSGILIQFIFLWMLQSRQLGVFAIANLDRRHVEKPSELCWILHFKFSTFISEICLFRTEWCEILPSQASSSQLKWMNTNRRLEKQKQLIRMDWLKSWMWIDISDCDCVKYRHSLTQRHRQWHERGKFVKEDDGEKRGSKTSTFQLSSLSSIECMCVSSGDVKAKRKKKQKAKGDGCLEFWRWNSAPKPNAKRKLDIEKNMIEARREMRSHHGLGQWIRQQRSSIRNGRCRTDSVCLLWDFKSSSFRIDFLFSLLLVDGSSRNWQSFQHQTAQMNYIKMFSVSFRLISRRFRQVWYSELMIYQLLNWCPCVESHRQHFHLNTEIVRDSKVEKHFSENVESHSSWNQEVKSMRLRMSDTDFEHIFMPLLSKSTDILHHACMSMRAL